MQAYVRKVNDASGPLKTLRGFQRIEIPAGKTVNATIHLPYSSFEFYDEASIHMAVTPGEYEIWYGSSSAAKDLKVVKLRIQP